LPPRLFKILPRRYAQRFLTDGEMQWSTLTWFQNHEDSTRRDAFEGTRRYFPIKGLEVHRSEHLGLPDNTNFLLPDHGMVSKALESNHIFIYSMTLNPALEIGNPADRTCVEIVDPHTFIHRLGAAVDRHRWARRGTLIYDEVKYWSSDRPPEEVWALPHMLTMHKHADFSSQREYRLAVGIRASVFDLKNIEGFMVHQDYRWPILTLDRQAHLKKLWIGSLTDCCRLLPLSR
jgi:hypothetical protein